MEINDTFMIHLQNTNFYFTNIQHTFTKDCRQELAKYN